MNICANCGCDKTECECASKAIRERIELLHIFGPDGVEHPGYRSADEAAHPMTGATHLADIASGRVVAGCNEGQAMARELLAIRAERTNEAHRAQLDAAKASVAKSLAAQFATKVRLIRLESNLYDHWPTGDGAYHLREFYQDLAANAVAGLTDLIARENEK